MEIPICESSSGHVGHFIEPDRDHLPLPGPHPGLIKFQALFVPAFLQTIRTSNETFTVVGPIYSLLYEAARKINYSLQGLAIQEDDGGLREEQLWVDFMTFNPDVVLFTFIAKVDSMMQGIEMGMATISDMVICVEMDHILSARKFKTANFLSILAPFDSISLVLIATGVLLISFIANHFKLKPTKLSVSDFFWNLATAAICSPTISTKAARWRLVGVIWAVGVYLLQQLFSGDMYTAMTLPPAFDVVDSFEDLALKTSGLITVLDTQGSDADNYQLPCREHEKELMKRVHVFQADQTLNSTLMEQLLLNVSKGIQYHLEFKDLINFHLERFGGSYKNRIHVSADFGQLLPEFLIFGANCEKKISEALNVVIHQMQESGIFGHWAASFLTQEKRSGHVDTDGYSQAHLKYFSGLFVICAGMLVFTSLVGVFEMSYSLSIVESNFNKKRKSKKNQVGPETTKPGTSTCSFSQFQTVPVRKGDSQRQIQNQILKQNLRNVLNE